MSKPQKKKKEKKYPELLQVRVNEEIMEILKNQENFSNFVRNLIINNDENKKCQETLDFLKSLFELGKVTINHEEITEEELAKLDEI